MRRERIAFAGLVVLLSVCPPLLAALTGDVRGTVLDSQGLPVGDATVTERNIGTGVNRTAMTGPAGQFSFLQLDVGAYEVRIEKQGFHTAITNVIVRSGEVIQTSIRMEVGPVTETVTVQAGAERLMDVTDSQVSTSLDAETISGLPEIARDPVALALLSPGIVAAPPNDSFVNSGNFSANGQRGRANNITVDNSLATDITATGWAATHTFSLDSVQE